MLTTMLSFSRLSRFSAISSQRFSRLLSTVNAEETVLSASEKSIMVEAATSAHNYHPIPVVLKKGKVVL